jgi:hypothetical protein
MTKIRIFLDVDSTIVMPKSPLINNCDSGATVTINFKNKDGKNFTRVEDLRWNSKVISFFSNLENVDIWWLTGWKEDAVLILDPLFNISSAGWLNWNFSDPNLEEGKLVSLLEKLKENNAPFIWLDDTLNVNPKKSLTDLSQFGKNLLIAPDPDFGLRDFELQNISNFIKENSN